MFKKIIAVLLLALVLCSCNTEETPEPVLPEEPVVSEEPEISKQEEEADSTEVVENEESIAEKIFCSEKHSEFISLFNKRIEKYKSGTFEEMPNHHSGYPENFPSAINLLPADKSNTVLAYRNTEKISEISWSDGEIDYVYFIDEYHAILLEPAELVMSDGTVTLSFANTGYMNAIAAGYETIGEWFADFYDGYYGEPLAICEPKLIAEHIAMLNELERETFGIKHLSWQEENYIRLYKEKPYGEGFELAAPPDKLLPGDTFYGKSVPEKYDGYYVDQNCEGVYPATNFSSKLEVFENLCKWFAPEVIEKSSFEDHVMDFNGEVYLLRHSRGYGMSYYGDSEIVEQTETEMTAVAKIYRIIKNEAGTAEIKFEKIDGRWIIVSVEDNYY